MASRPKGFGMTAELNDKKAAKYDKALAAEALQWINQQIGSQRLDATKTDANDVQEALKSGVILCELGNAIGATKTKRMKPSKLAFKMMENINFFLEACEEKGVPKSDVFQTVDLYEGQNMAQVISGIHALGRKMGTLGPKESAQNKREFTDEQLKAGQNVIGLQMGTNKGASQAGQSFGKPRSILD